MAEFMLEAAIRNDKGKVRQNNEDNFYLDGHWLPLDKIDNGAALQRNSHAPVQVFAVCDGMGGESSGEVASHAAVQALHTLYRRSPHGIDLPKLTKGLNDVSSDIYRDAHQKGARSGTTFVGLLWENGTMRAANVGDSRAYRMSLGKLEQLSVDHSEVQRMVSMGLLTPEAARVHSKRHVINQYLGMPSQEVAVEPSISRPIPGQIGDRYLLCSDGLTDMVDDAAIEKILSAAPDAVAASAQLVEKALENGGKDNITVLCVYVRKGGPAAGRLALQRAMLLGGIALGATGLAFLAEFIHRLL